MKKGEKKDLMATGKESVLDDAKRETMVIVPHERLPLPRDITSKEDVKKAIADVTARQEVLRRVIENLFPGQGSATFIFTDEGTPILYVSNLPRMVMVDWVTTTIASLVDIDSDEEQFDQTDRPPTESVH